MGLPLRHDARRDPPPGRRPPFSTIYKAHFTDVVRWIRLLGVPERETEDIAQDVFADVHASLDRYDPARPLLAWLRAIAAHSAQDFLKSARHRREAPDALEDGMMPIDTRPDAERQTQQRQAQRLLIDVLRELSDDHREVFVMHAIEELSIPEIAETLSIPENTVRSRLQRARASFHELVDARRARKGSEAHAALLMPALLLDAGRAPFEVDPAMAARVWSKLVRLLGIGVIGTLAPLSATGIAAGAAVVFALGGGAGALLTRALTPTPEPAAPREVATAIVTAEPDGTGLPAASVAPSSSSPPRVEDAGAPRERGDTLRMEQGYLDRAWSLFQAGQSEAALRELERHERLYPDGALVSRRRRLKQQIKDDMGTRDGGSR